MLEPYQDYLRKKANQVDLHSIKNRVDEKIGVFDYVKFEGDINDVVADIKGEMGQFYLVCQQYKVDVPEMKFDAK